jgi:CheY-like chemotaxis protein
MKRILIVETDPVLRGIYRRKFEMSGFLVETADDGPKALNQVSLYRPELVLMDLILPGMEGTQVIREIRSLPDFKTVPIIVLSSFYRPDLAKQAWEAGASKCVSKMDCTPNLALELVEQVFSGETISFGAPTPMNRPVRGTLAVAPMAAPEEHLLPEATPPFATSPSLPPPSRPPSLVTAPPFSTAPSPPAGPPPRSGQPDLGGVQTPSEATVGHFPTPPSPPLDAPPSSGQTDLRRLQTPSRATVAPFPETPAAPSGPPARAGQAEPALATTAPDQGSNPAQWVASTTSAFRLEIRQEFFRRVPQIQADLRDRVSALIKSKSPGDQLRLLDQLNVSVSSLTGLAGVTGYTRIAHLSGALEALIKELQKKPKQMTSSVLRTMAHASDCLNLLVRDAKQMAQSIPQSILILVVDDEPISRRTISVALGKASLRCLCLEDSRMALKILEDNPFDLIFLDAEMPGLNGFELCSELRKMPTNNSTPVIFVTSLTHFEIRARSSLSGGNDLIAKPFLMMELAVKALTYLLKPRVSHDPKALSATLPHAD